MKITLVTAAVVAASVPLGAAQYGPPVREGATIAYVSGQRLSNESSEGQAGLKRVQALQQQKANEVRALSQALEKTRQQLAQTADSPARMQLQQQELQQRTDLERATAAAQQEIQKLQRDLAADLQAKIRNELTELLKGTNVQVVLQLESTIVWTAPGLDLTSAVIQRLNAKAGAASPGAAQ